MGLLDIIFSKFIYKKEIICIKLKKKGFTLAEVLITLLVIGVVASMVVPAIINDTRNAELQTAAKKALSIANQAYKLAANDNGGGFGPCNVGVNTHIKFNALKSKLNVIKYCPYASHSFGNCWASSGVGPKNIIINGCGQWSNSESYQDRNNSFVTADRMFWMIYSYNPPPNGSDILAVDVNGNKGPNDWGKDVFAFKLNDMTITPLTNCGDGLLHNDTTPVTSSEFLTPFK